MISWINLDLLPLSINYSSSTATIHRVHLLSL